MSDLMIDEWILHGGRQSLLVRFDRVEKCDGLLRQEVMRWWQRVVVGDGEKASWRRRRRGRKAKCSHVARDEVIRRAVLVVLQSVVVEIHHVER